MTEDEWLSPQYVRCRAMLYAVKQVTRTPFAVQSRRYRLLAVAFVRRNRGRSAEVERACELVERYVDGEASQAEFRDAQTRLSPGPEAVPTVLHYDGFLAAVGFLGFNDASTAALIRDVFGNPFRPAAFAPEWRTDTAVLLARQMYESRDFSAMAILADALQDAGCDDDDILAHCRSPEQVHVRGCWVCDLVLGRA